MYKFPHSRLLLIVALILTCGSANTRVMARQLSLTSNSSAQRQDDRELKLSGTVVAGNQVTIRNKTQVSLPLIYVVEEGTLVKEGDLIARLDTAKLEEQAEEQNIAFKTSRARLDQTEQALAIAERNTKLAKYKSELQIDAIEHELKQLDDKHSQHRLEQDILAMNLKLEQARTDFLTRRLARFKSEKDKESVEFMECEFKLIESKLQLGIMKKQLELNSLSNDQRKRQLTLQKESVSMVCEQEVRQSDAEMRSLVAEREVKKLETEQAEDRLKRTVASLRQCELLAPVSGKVFYAHNQNARTGFVVEEGAIIRANQTILYLPDLAALEVEIMVPEATVAQIKPGQPALIQSESQGEAVTLLKGKIKRVASFPDSNAWIKSGKKTYAVKIALENSRSLKIGQSVMARIRLK